MAEQIYNVRFASENISITSHSIRNKKQKMANGQKLIKDNHEDSNRVCHKNCSTTNCLTTTRDYRIAFSMIQWSIFCMLMIFVFTGCSFQHKNENMSITSQFETSFMEPSISEITGQEMITESSSNINIVDENQNDHSDGNDTGLSNDHHDNALEPVQQIRKDYQAFLPNEAGRIPVVMFHKFVEAFDSTMDKNYTNTFEQFRNLLQVLYDDGFRLISMQDFLTGHVSIPAGYKPIVFTFDDGAISQYNLMNDSGSLELNPLTAVGYLKAFNDSHPDFGMKGMFFLNMDMGENTFRGAGSLKERLLYLENLGFEIGTHTWEHIDFREYGAKSDIEKALGKNEKALQDILPDQSFTALALPYGSRPKDKNNRIYLASGIWESIEYHLNGVFAVGAGYSFPVYDQRFDSLYIPRVRATGKEPAEADLDWWLENAADETYYKSDGDPDLIVIPKDREENISLEKLGSMILTTYETLTE